MSNADKLIAAGAQCVGGDLIWKHKVMGSFRNGDFQITEDGKAVLDMDITDVEVKEPKKPAAKKAKVVDAVETGKPADEFDLDSLLA